jgi:hypothetical protein
MPECLIERCAIRKDWRHSPECRYGWFDRKRELGKGFHHEILEICEIEKGIDARPHPGLLPQEEGEVLRALGLLHGLGDATARGWRKKECLRITDIEAAAAMKNQLRMP